ncbi:MAG: hypothetical protein JO050_07600, partial [Acidimicrobiia bacterium]|nr:hypothetical protein [Acidimicrobiia bacterium]
SYGENDIAEADLLNSGSAPLPGGNPLVSATPTGSPASANFNDSFTYLFPNGDGTFGVGAVNEQVLAPLAIGRGLAPAGKDLVDVSLLGMWVLRVEDSGKGAPTVTYAAYDTATGAQLTGATVVADVDVAGTQVLALTAQQVFGPNGFSIAIPPPPTTPTLLQLSIGTPPTAIAGMTNGLTTDAVRLTALNVPPPTGFTLGDVAYGHMESQAQAPAGGLDCPLPVTKTFLNSSGQPVPSLAAGNNFSWQITFPSADISKELACTLTNIKVTDVATVTSGDPRATINSASNGGVIGSNQVGPGTGQQASVTWSLPDYHPGDPPVVLTLGGTIPATSGSGVITNTAHVTATLGACTGGAGGQAFVTNAAVSGKAATINGSAVSGASAVNASVSPAAVLPANLATTGLDEPWLPVAGGAFLLGALALFRGRRRALFLPAPSEDSSDRRSG